MTMKANELRIGNWVNHSWIHNNGANINWEHKQIVPNDIPACVKYSETYEPIPLTQDWLFRFGFNHLLYNPRLVNFYVKNTGYNPLIVFKENGSQVMYGNTDLFYVHQLQNLYFALTGEELTLTPL